MEELFASRRIPFQGIANFRDLGGFPTENGYTRYHRFFRSTHLAKATVSDLEKLQALRIGTVLDLRHPSEIAVQPDMIPENTKYMAISLLGPMAPQDIRVNSQVRDTKTLFTMYKQIIENSQSAIREVITFLSETPDPVLFHCAAGKDRTGLIAMFLLSIVGADRMDIIADYENSRTYIQDFSNDVSGSNYHNMDKLLGYLQNIYGGPVHYLHDIGVSEGVMEKLAIHFMKKNKLAVDI